MKNILNRIKYIIDISREKIVLENIEKQTLQRKTT